MAQLVPWLLVYDYFAQWQVDGTLYRLHQASNHADRQAQRTSRQRPHSP